MVTINDRDKSSGVGGANLDAMRIIRSAQEQSAVNVRNIWQAPVTLPAAAIDTTVTSLANITDGIGITDFDLHDGIMPSGWEGYQESKEMWQTTADVASMFFVAGAAAKAARVGGGISKAAKHYGMSDDAISKLMSDRRRQAAIEKEVADKWGEQTLPPAMHGENVSGMDDIATSYSSLGGKVLTQAQAKSAGLALSRNNVIKETIAAEVAIAAVMNDSDFIFPEDASLGSYLIGFGFAGGVATGVERVIATAAYRKSRQQVLARSAAIAEGVRANSPDMFSRGVMNAPGSRWTVAEEAAAESRRFDMAVSDARANGATGDQVLAMQQQTSRFKANAEQRLLGSFDAAGKDTVLDGVSKSVNISSDQRLKLAKLTKERRGQMFGVHSLEDTDVQASFAKRENQLARMEVALDKKGPSKKLDEVRKEIKKLRGMRPAVIEADGAINQTSSRKKPWQEQATGNATGLKQGANNRYFVSKDKGAPRMQLFQGGTLARGEPGRSLKAVGREGSLSFDEATATWKLVAQGAESEWARAFENSFDGNWQALPYHVLDAVDGGLIDASKGLRPELADLELARQRGELAVTSARRKYFALVNSREIGNKNGYESHFDLGKRLGWRLHDVNGNENELSAALTKLTAQGIDNLPGDTMDEIATALSSMIGGDPRTKKRILDALGDKSMLTLHKEPNPVGALRSGPVVLSDTDVNMSELAEAMRNTRMEHLHSMDDELVQGIFSTLRELPTAVRQASDVAGLARDSLIEAGGLRQAARAVTTTPFRFRDMPAIQAANTINQALTRLVDDQTRKLLAPIAERFAAYKRTGRTEMLAAHAQYTGAFRAGAALADDYLVAGFNRLDADHPRVQGMVERLFPGRSVDDITGGNDLLLFDIQAAKAGRYEPINLDAEAAGAMNAIVDASYRQLDIMNAISRVMGRKEIARVKGHVPAADFTKLHVRYLGNAETLQVTGYVAGKTPAEADAMLREAIDAETALGRPSIARSNSEIMGYLDAVDHVQMQNMRNMSDVAQQTGPAKGRAAVGRLDVSGDLIQDQLLAMRESMGLLKDRVLYTAMEPVLHQNRKLNAAGNAVNDGGHRTSRAGELQTNSAPEEYENVLFGRSSRPKGSIAYKMDSMFSETVESAMRWAAGLRPQRSATMSKAEQAAYDRLTQNGFAPFKEAISTLKTSPSVDDRKLAQVLQVNNKITTEVFLKYANLMHPLLNMLSIAVTTPGVSQTIVPRRGETAKAFRARAGEMAEYFDEDSLTAAPSAAKMMIEGTQFMWSGKAQPALEEAARRGMIEANMMEELNGAIFSNPSKLADVGDWVRRNLDFVNTPYNAMQKARGVAQTADTVSERSETFARSFMHATGYNYINKVGRADLTEGEKHAFAHWFANQNIADYSPNIRGEMFRGTMGIPLGLFQSFGINFLQRMFRMVENKDSKALAVQAGMQATIFGGQGLPGFNQLNSMFMSAWERGGDDDSSVSSRIYNAYGKEMGDVMMLGVPSQLPRLFGGGDGLNLYTSGDANPRIQSPVPPSFSLAAQLVQGANAGIKAGMEEAAIAGHGGGFGAQRVAEVIASYAPNRGVRSITELALGYSTDRSGDLLQENTRTGMNLLARILGTRTVSETRQREALYLNRRDLQARRDRLTQVGRSLAATVRAASEEGGDLPEGFFEPYLQRYLAQGGREDTFKQWLSNWLEKAEVPEIERDVAKLMKDGKLKSPSYSGLVSRIGMTGYEPAPE